MRLRKVDSVPPDDELLTRLRSALEPDADAVERLYRKALEAPVQARAPRVPRLALALAALFCLVVIALWVGRRPGPSPASSEATVYISNESGVLMVARGDQVQTLIARR